MEASVAAKDEEPPLARVETRPQEAQGQVPVRSGYQSNRREGQRARAAACMWGTALLASTAFWIGGSLVIIALFGG